MEVQEFNERERNARLDAYFSAIKEMIPTEQKNESEDKTNEKG